jgi:hypothetical protein
MPPIKAAWRAIKRDQDEKVHGPPGLASVSHEILFQFELHNAIQKIFNAPVGERLSKK